VRRITKAVLGGVAGGALILGGTQVASGVLSTIFREQSEDLLTASSGPLDSAKATVAITVDGNSTTFRIDVTKIDMTKIDSLQEDKPFGSHLHTGPCIEGLGTSAGPHYNHDVVYRNKEWPVPGEKTYGYTAEVSAETEVWFDLKPVAGVASHETTVPFVPVDPDGVMSVVVHLGPTNTDPLFGPVGGAGPRQACFPLSVKGIFPETVTK
jgi:superoxide dismutase, Cu-Zn family